MGNVKKKMSLVRSCGAPREARLLRCACKQCRPLHGL